MKKIQLAAVSAMDQSDSRIAKAASHRVASVALQPDTAGLNETPVFEDPRSNLDRRQRRSVFFTKLRERRHQNRRNACALGHDWWIRRNYFQDQTQQEQ